MDHGWLANAARKYHSSNRRTLEWMLSRAQLKGAFIDTKVNSISGKDYDDRSGLRGPAFTYGWIQGRGLEALTTFAKHYRETDSAFAAQLEARVRVLFEGLSELYNRDGHVHFLYDDDMRPARNMSGKAVPQVLADRIYTYADAFAAKGLIAASGLVAPEQTPDFVSYLDHVVDALECGRFQMDENRELSAATISAEPDDFGPRMIVLGAAGLLHRSGLSQSTDFADRFIDHVLDRHFDPITGLLFNVPGQDICNVGHAIEFSGFAFEHLAALGEDPRVAQIGSVLRRSLEVGLQGPGIALYLSAASGNAVSPYYPWWPMPEAVRACALGLCLGADRQLFELWQRADEAFFSNYWRDDYGYALQTRTLEGPCDFVPATPDLDPAYHTALSLLTAALTIDSLGLPVDLQPKA